ncbi:MAG: GNAT family N-acetyltransferase [Chitinophagales bacterium]|nr:GNAT family N-acetyltransferase [Chitinophagales bacterium]MDW8394111.1 GNAT family N-acetyltransferase [Chitinophagales bacterium]
MNRTERQQFYANHLPAGTPVFHQPWWLQACCGSNWDAVTLSGDSGMEAYYVYAFRHSLLGLHLLMPPLTAYLGPAILAAAPDAEHNLHRETELLIRLEDNLPACIHFESRWQPQYQNWLPFHWKKYHQSVRYTHLLKLPAEANDLHKGFSEKIHREIARAEKRYVVSLANDTDALFGLVSETLRRKKAFLNFSASYLRQLFAACQTHHAGAIWHAVTDDGKIHAAVFIVWDKEKAYYVIGGRSPGSGNSGAMSLLFWEVFKHLCGRTKVFDFEGSMLEGVGSYFRSFGARCVPYFSLRKTSHWLLRSKEALKYVLKGKLWDF